MLSVGNINNSLSQCTLSPNFGIFVILRSPIIQTCMMILYIWKCFPTICDHIFCVCTLHRSHIHNMNNMDICIWSIQVWRIYFPKLGTCNRNLQWTNNISKLHFNTKISFLYKFQFEKSDLKMLSLWPLFWLGDQFYLKKIRNFLSSKYTDIELDGMVFEV